MAKGDKHIALKKAAIKFFPRFGYKGTTLRMLAKEACMTNPALYIHYKNKDEFLLSLFTEITQRNVKRLEGYLLEIDDPFEKILTIIDLIFLYSQNHYDEFRFLMFCIEHYKEKLLKKKFKLLPHVIAEVITEGQKKNVFVKQNPFFLSVIIVHIVKSTIIAQSLKFISKKDIDIEFIKNIIIKIIKK